MNGLNRDTFAVRVEFYAGYGFDTNGAFSNLPADQECKMLPR